MEASAKAVAAAARARSPGSDQRMVAWGEQSPSPRSPPSARGPQARGCARSPGPSGVAPPSTSIGGSTPEIVAETITPSIRIGPETERARDDQGGGACCQRRDGHDEITALRGQSIARRSSPPRSASGRGPLPRRRAGSRLGSSRRPRRPHHPRDVVAASRGPGAAGVCHRPQPPSRFLPDHPKRRAAAGSASPSRSSHPAGGRRRRRPGGSRRRQGQGSPARRRRRCSSRCAAEVQTPLVGLEHLNRELLRSSPRGPLRRPRRERDRAGSWGPTAVCVSSSCARPLVMPG